MEKLKSVAANAFIIAVIAIVLIWIMTWQRQRTQYNRGEAALVAGQHIEAIAAYESAIHMYTPGSTVVARSAEKLWSIGEGLERAGDPARALIAYRSLRSSFYAARGLSAPGKDWIRKCDDKITALVHAQSLSVSQQR